jgi:cell division protein FtsA
VAQNKISIGIDIGSAQIKIAVVEFSYEGDKQGGKRVPKILGTGLAPSRGVRRGYIEDTEELSEALALAIRNAEKSSGIKIKHAEISVGDTGLSSFISTGFTMVGRADMEINDLDINKATENSEETVPKSFTQNKRVLHRIPVASKIDGKVVFDGKPIGMKGSKLEIKNLFVTCLEPHLTHTVKALEANNVEIEDVIASPIAGSLACLSKTQKMTGCILVNIGAGTTSLIVYEDNLPISLEVIPFGGNDITNDIALGLKISIEEAEAIKVGAQTFTNISKKKLDEIIDARLSDIFELVETHLKKISRNAMLPAGIFLTGGGAKLAGIDVFARDFLKLPAKVVSIPTGQVGKVAEPIWSVAYGLCLAGTSNNGVEGLSSGSNGFFIAKNKVFTWLKQFLP